MEQLDTEEPFEEVRALLERLVKSRNMCCQQFDNDKLMDHEAASGLLELERLRMEEAKLTEELKEMETQYNVYKDVGTGNIENKRKKLQDLKKNHKQNCQTLTKIRNKRDLLKQQQAIHVAKMQDLIHKMTFGKSTIDTFILNNGSCQDKEFCQIFSGGKCDK